MNTLYIDQTATTPKIRFSDSYLLLWGTFVPVDPLEFYLPLLEWVKEYSNAPAPETIVDIYLIYTRGYAMHYIQKLLQELIAFHDDQHQIIINWHFSPDSLDVKAGKHLSRMLKHCFNFVKVERNMVIPSTTDFSGFCEL
jgi:hypothetical protein